MGFCAARTRARVETNGADTGLLIEVTSGKDDMKREESSLPVILDTLAGDKGAGHVVELDDNERVLGPNSSASWRAYSQNVTARS